MKEIKLGIVGLGVISRYYLSALDRLPGVRLTAVCDLDERAMRPYGQGVTRHLDHRDLLERADVDAIVVNVPNDKHVEVCRDTILAGRSVCVEKPIATRLDEGRELVRLARRQGAVLFTAFHRRYNDNVLAALRAIGGAAPVESMTVRYLERIEEHVGRDRWYLDPARCGGGCVADNGPNAFDLVRMFQGEVEVENALVSRDSLGVDRQALIRLRAAGATAAVRLDWSYDSGERKDIDVRLADGTEIHADMLAGHPGFKSSLEHEYVGVLEDFSRAVRAGEDRSQGGLAALELVDASYRAEHAAVRAGAL